MCVEMTSLDDAKNWEIRKLTMVLLQKLLKLEFGVTRASLSFLLNDSASTSF